MVVKSIYNYSNERRWVCYLYDGIFIGATVRSTIPAADARLFSVHLIVCLATTLQAVCRLWHQLPDDGASCAWRCDYGCAIIMHLSASEGCGYCTIHRLPSTTISVLGRPSIKVRAMARRRRGGPLNTTCSRASLINRLCDIPYPLAFQLTLTCFVDLTSPKFRARRCVIGFDLSPPLPPIWDGTFRKMGMNGRDAGRGETWDTNYSDTTEDLLEQNIKWF